MDRYLVHGIIATVGCVVVLALLELLLPARAPAAAAEDPDDAAHMVWDVLEEARRITQAAAEE